LPIRLVKETLKLLVDAGIIIEVILPNVREYGYQPSKDVSKLTLGYVLMKVETVGTTNTQMAVLVST
jgi:hypothetical protein